MEKVGKKKIRLASPGKAPIHCNMYGNIPVGYFPFLQGRQLLVIWLSLFSTGATPKEQGPVVQN